MNTNTHLHMHAITVSDNRGCEPEGEQGGFLEVDRKGKGEME